MDDEFDGLGGSLLAAQDLLEAVLQEVDAAALRCFCALRARRSLRREVESRGALRPQRSRTLIRDN